MRSLLAYGDNNATVEEKVTLRIKADNNGDVYVPVAGYSSDGTQNCKYSWKISIDGGTANNYSGTGGVFGIRVGYGLTPLSVHTVTIKPQVEEYGWLRAFGYRGTNYAPYLINIISDKSYKGYALSALFTGDWYKAYQYYGCTNLINTDEELLPGTLEIIGNYYRYYEYAGCTSLVGNAEEKILKTVKAIGDNYRAYQYQNCTGLKRVDMRAVNWASVGNNYRYNQYSGIATEKKPVTIYIEGGIEEGGSWGLSDTRVKDIYVYYGLVADYKAKLSGITETKIKKYDKWDVLEYEFIEFIAIADSTGKIRIPIGGLSTTMSQDCAYDWMVSIDGGEAEEISGTGSDTYVSVGSGLIERSEHRVIIKPKTIGWGWGKAFGYLSTGAEAYIKELIHDSYKCFAVSRVDTGAHYKHATFAGCTNLINSYEKLPTSVETVGGYYMKECYAGCTGLKNAFWEVMHSGATIGVDYRYHEYTGCTALEVHQGIAGYTGETYPTNYKYEYLSGAGNSVKVYITRYEALASGLTNSMGLSNSRVSAIYCYVDNLYGYVNNTYWSGISDIKFQVYYYDYQPLETTDITKYTRLIGEYGMPTRGQSYDYDYDIGGFDENLRGIAPTGGNSVRVPGYRYSRNTGKVWGCIYRVMYIAGLSTAIDLGASSDIMTGSGGEVDGNVRNFYVDYKGNIIYGWARKSSGGYNYKEMQGRVTFTKNENYSGWMPYISASRDGRYVFADGKKYYSSTKWGNATEYQSVGGGYTSMEFSEDGMTAYLASSFGNITQYNLKAPRDLTSMVSSGKTKSVSGQFAFSKDFKYLYVYNGNLTVYEYQP